MTFIERLNQLGSNRNSLVCVSLDVVLAKISKSIFEEKEPRVFFSQAIFDAIIEYIAANKKDQSREKNEVTKTT
jgi:hypothetical protein